MRRYQRYSEMGWIHSEYRENGSYLRRTQTSTSYPRLDLIRNFICVLYDLLCDVVFDHFAVVRYNGGCSEQVTTLSTHSPNLLITPDLNLCQGQQKSKILSSFITSSLKDLNRSPSIPGVKKVKLWLNRPKNEEVAKLKYSSILEDVMQWNCIALYCCGALFFFVNGPLLICQTFHFILYLILCGY